MHFVQAPASGSPQDRIYSGRVRQLSSWVKETLRGSYKDPQHPAQGTTLRRFGIKMYYVQRTPHEVIQDCSQWHLEPPWSVDLKYDNNMANINRKLALRSAIRQNHAGPSIQCVQMCIL